MKLMLTLFISALVCGAELAVAAPFQIPPTSVPSTFRGFVKVRADRELFVEYSQARPGYPTLILLNGLTYGTRQFDDIAKIIVGKGLGLLRFDFDGMGLSLLRYAPSRGAYSADQQVRDTKAVLMAMRIPGPYNLAGLSYGGGIALAYAKAFPREVKNLILMAPYTEPLSAQDQGIRAQIAWTRIMFPLNPASDDELYDFFLHQNIFLTYPAFEPIVLENPYKLEGIYNLVRGIRHLRPIDDAGLLPARSVHLLVAAKDEYIPAVVLEKYWSRVPPSARMSRIRIEESKHKMTEQVPRFVAAWISEILKGNPLLQGGRDFQGLPSGHKFRHGNREYPLEP